LGSLFSFSFLLSNSISSLYKKFQVPFDYFIGKGRFILDKRWENSQKTFRKYIKTTPYIRNTRHCLGKKRHWTINSNTNLEL